MSTYREIVGKKIRKVTSDPSTGIDGQMWYNSTTGSIRGLAVLEAWTSSAPMSTAMDQLGGTGTQTAALAGAGGGLTTFEEYDGSGWAAGGAIPTAMELIQQLAGTQTAAICKGGLTPPPGARYNNEAYTYNGSAWSSIPDSGDVRIRGAAAGTQTAFLIAGGASGPPTFTNRLSSSEEYDGSSWTEGGSMSTAREFLSGFGTQTAAIMAGGSVPPSYGNSNASEQYNGTAFSSTPNINTARYGLAGSGTSTSNLIYGGGTGSNSAATESYDGTSWSNKPSMSTARIYLTRAGDSSSSALASAGNTGSAVGTTEEFTKSTNVITAAAWASAPALNTARDALQIGSVGTQTAGIAFGGRTSPPESFKNETEEYDGSSWSENNNLNDARFAGAGFGTQTAAVMAGGNRPGSSPDGRSDVEEYDGSSWTNATDIPAGRYGAMGAGTLTAGIVAGGATGTYPFTAQSTSFEYDGTNWTSSGTMNKGRWIGASCGPQTAALFFGGSDTTSSPNTTNTESYNGSAFTALSALLTATRQNMGSGDTSSAISYGGGNPSAVTTAFNWNGTSWATAPSLSAVRQEGSSSGTASAAITAGGSPPDAGLSTSEEFTGETTAGNIKTFSTS